MEAQERNEIQDMLHQILSGYQAKNESCYEIINLKLEHIKEQTTRTNGRVTVLEDKVAEHLPHNITKCPQSATIESLKTSMITSKGIKTFLISSIVLTSVIIGTIFTIYKLFGGKTL
jgi:hypothetical protein